MRKMTAIQRDVAEPRRARGRRRAPKVGTAPRRWA